MAIGTEYTVTAEKKRYRLVIYNLARLYFNGGVEEEEIEVGEEKRFTRRHKGFRSNTLI